MRRITLLAAAALASAVLLLGASPPPISLSQAISEAEAVSDRLRLQEVSVRTAESSPLADPRAGSPSIRLGARDLEGSGDAFAGDPGDPEYVARARIPLPRPWDLATAANQGKATVAREEAQLESLRASLRLEVTRRYHTLPMLQDAVEIAERLASLAADHLQLVDARRGEGLSTELEWLESEEERRDADEDRASVRSDLRRVRAEFLALLGRSPGAAVEVERPDVLGRALAPFPRPDETAARGREPLDVVAARADIERAAQRLVRVKLRALPWLDWFQGGVVFKSGNRPRFEVGAAIDIPIQQWGNQRYREAELDLTAARIRLEAVQRRHDAQLADRLQEAGAARERWLVEREHHQALQDHATPVLPLANPLLKLQLQGRLARAELRQQLALITYIQRLDRLDSTRER